MLASKIIRTFLFRSIAYFLLLVSLAMLGTPENNFYSQAKLFVKSPAPQSFSYFTDDIKDVSEDGAFDVQTVSDVVIDQFVFQSHSNQSRCFVNTQIIFVKTKAFLHFGQLLL